MTAECYTIGQVAQQCDVPVKTIRYYTEEGLLTPRGGTTEAGYRLYTDEDMADLRAIRNLRSLGFSLDAIKKMREGAADPHGEARLQLEIIDSQLKGLARQRAIVSGALASEDAGDVSKRLQLGVAAASLSAAEREMVVDRFLEKAGRQVGQGPSADIRRGILGGVPVELDATQLEAWVELSSLLNSKELLETLRHQHEPFVKAGPQAGAKFGEEIKGVLDEAVAALSDGASPESDRVQRLVDRWSDAVAGALGRKNDVEFQRWLAAYAERTNDPRIERFWRLVAVLKGQRWEIPPFTKAQDLLLQGLRRRLDGGAI